MPIFEEDPGIEKIARQLVAKISIVDHIDLKEVQFFRETQTKPKAAAKCFKVGDHPVGFYTDKKYIIVIYWACCDYMSKEQLALLVLHEMMHIPKFGDKMVDHNIKDFREILGIDLDWSEPGREVPDLIGKKSVTKGNKAVQLRPVKNRA